VPNSHSIDKRLRIDRFLVCRDTFYKKRYFRNLKQLYRLKVLKILP